MNGTTNECFPWYSCKILKEKLKNMFFIKTENVDKLNKKKPKIKKIY